VILVLDASMALAWCITRTAPAEAALAQQAILSLSFTEVYVPAVWYAEFANTLLVFERAKRLTSADSNAFLANLAFLPIRQDESAPASQQPGVIAVGRTYQLTAYDAVYLELAGRKNAALATFDRELAEAYRKSGGRVFGDPS
jgi:predicted nucleic acid-binding protein